MTIAILNPSNRYRKDIAFHFDQDGVILDTERVRQNLWIEASREFGLRVPDNAFRFTIGLRREQILAEIQERFAFSADGAEALYRRRNELFEQFRSANDGIPLREGAARALETLEALKIPCTLVTNTPTLETAKNLSAHQLERAFVVRVHGDDVTQPKPHPEGYERAVALINVPAEISYGVEDSPFGMRAAFSAHLRVIAMRDMIPVPEDLRRNAIYVSSRRMKRIADFATASVHQLDSQGTTGKRM